MRIDFYLLNDNNPQARYPYACRIIEKAFRKGHKIYIHTGSETETHHIDDLLWTQVDDSFIPHNIIGEGPMPPPPVQVGHAAEPKGFNDLLINLCNEAPSFSGKFRRMIEIIPDEEGLREAGRERFKLYRQQGHEITTHKV